MRQYTEYLIGSVGQKKDHLYLLNSHILFITQQCPFDPNILLQYQFKKNIFLCLDKFYIYPRC